MGQHLDPEQAGFRPVGQFIEDGYKKGSITGAAIVDLSVAYETVNHKIRVQKSFQISKYVRLTKLVQNMMASRRFFVDLAGKRSRLRRQNNGLYKGGVLAPV